MSLFRPLKYIANVTESKSIQIMKIARIIYNYCIKPNKTLDIYIVKLPSCIETLLCGSRKYPYPPTEGIGFSRGEGGVNLPNFPVGRGVTIGKYFQRVLVTRKRVTKKEHKNLPRQFICEDIKHDES